MARHALIGAAVAIEVLGLVHGLGLARRFLMGAAGWGCWMGAAGARCALEAAQFATFAQ